MPHREGGDTFRPKEAVELIKEEERKINLERAAQAYDKLASAIFDINELKSKESTEILGAYILITKMVKDAMNELGYKRPFGIKDGWNAEQDHEAYPAKVEHVELLVALQKRLGTEIANQKAKLPELKKEWD